MWHAADAQAARAVAGSVQQGQGKFLPGKGLNLIVPCRIRAAQVLTFGRSRQDNPNETFLVWAEAA